MTATTKTSKATDSTAKLDDVDPIDVNASTVGDNDKTEAPAEDNKDDQAPQPKVDPKTVVNNVKEAVEWARQREAVDNARSTAAQALQNNGHYHDFGCFYGSATPVANALGAEVGVVTKDEKTKKVQRTGVGFYIRSDHMADVKYDCSDF
jgi:hypothetical protein